MFGTGLVANKFVYYGDLVFKFKIIIGKNDFPYQFKQNIALYKKIGYNIDICDRRQGRGLVDRYLVKASQ